MTHPLVAWFPLAALVLAAPLAAQSADSLHLTGDVGLVNTAGNTDLTTINVGEEVGWRHDRLALGQTFAVVYGRSEGQITSSLWQAGLRADYSLSDRVAAYAATGYHRDRFAGIARRFEEGAGVAVKLARGPRDVVETETGLSLVQQRSTTATDDDFVSARGAVTYAHHFTGTTYLQQVLEGIANLENGDDFRVNSETSVVAPLSGSLALKVGYVIHYDHLPEPGFRATDRLLTSGLQITL